MGEGRGSKSDHHFEHLTSSSIRYLGVDLKQELVLKRNIKQEMERTDDRMKRTRIIEEVLFEGIAIHHKDRSEHFHFDLKSDFHPLFAFVPIGIHPDTT